MSQYYNPKRVRNIFDPRRHDVGGDSFRLSRSKIDLFLNCPRCFYLDRRLGVAQPPGFPFSLNSAVDTLLKKEFDIHRAKRTPHPLMKAYKIKAVPYNGPEIDKWRDALRAGIQHIHPRTNFLVTGGVDDIWQDEKGNLIVVDYKATSKNGEVSLDADWQIGYKRQVEVYQWLLRQNKFSVSDNAYFVYCNGDADREAFDAKLEFDIKVIPYEGDASWVDDVLFAAHECLMANKLPASGSDCDFCLYREAAQTAEHSL